MNSSLPNTMSAVRMAFAYLIDPRDAEELGTFRPLEVIAKQGTIVWAFPAGAGDAVHQPLRPGDRRVDHQGAGAGLPRAGHRRLGPSLPHRDQGRQSADRPAVHLAHVPRASGRRGRRPATAGRPRARARRPAGSSSAASRSPRRASRCLRAPRVRPDSGGDGSFRGGVGPALSCAWTSRQPAVANTAGDGVRHAPYGLLGGGDGLPTAIDCARGTAGERSRPRRSACRPARRRFDRVSGGGGYGPARRRSAEARQRDAVNGLVSGSARKSARWSTKRTTGRG